MGNLATFVVAAIIAVFFFAVIINSIKKHKNGKCSCSGGCAGCKGGCCNINTEKVK